MKTVGNKLGKRKSVMFQASDKNNEGAEDTIMFDAALEIKQFGHLMAANFNDAHNRPVRVQE